MKNKRCDNCGSTTFKEGRVGSAYHAYVCEDESSRFFQEETLQTINYILFRMW